MRQLKPYIVKDRNIYIGLEDSKVNWKLCVRSDDRIIHETSMPAKYPVLKSYLLNKFPGCKIKLLYEAGFRGFNLYDKLTEDNIECIVTPPGKVTEEKNSRQKSDKRDCRRLAKILEINDYKSCYVPDKERRQDRQVSRTLVGVQKDMTRTRNRIRKYLEYHGLDDDFKPGAWSESDYTLLKEKKYEEMVQYNLDTLLVQLDQLKEHKTSLQKKLREIAQKKRYKNIAELFASAPGIGPMTAIRLVLEWGEDMSRFNSAKHFASYTGLVCSEYSSGETQRYGRITSQSAEHVRAWLIQCAWIAYKRDEALLDKFERVWKNSGNKKKAIVAVARMLAVRLRACALTNTPYCLGVVK